MYFPQSDKDWIPEDSLGSELICVPHCMAALVSRMLSLTYIWGHEAGNALWLQGEICRNSNFVRCLLEKISFFGKLE